MPELAEKNITIRMPSIPTTEAEKASIKGSNEYLNAETQSEVLGKTAVYYQRRG